MRSEPDAAEPGAPSGGGPAPDWAPSGRRLLSGLLGLNLVLLGAALVAGRAFNPGGLRHQEPRVYMLLLTGAGSAWMLWYLLGARRHPRNSPHKDHHAGGGAVTAVLLLFAAFSLLLFLFRTGYLLSVRRCQPAARLLAPFVEAAFLCLQTYFLWAHSKDCVQRHKLVTRTGLMAVLSADLLLWLDAVTEDTVHQEIELEREEGLPFGRTDPMEMSDLEVLPNSSSCRCSSSASCLTFRKGFEILYPFNMEFYLMAGCMVYVLWKNVGRQAAPTQVHATQKLTLRIIHRGGIVFGLAFGGLVLVAGVTVFILYQVWVVQPQLRLSAFLVFYGYHLTVMPLMSLCSLAGLLVHRLERRAHEGDHNPTRSLDVVLLVAAALGQLGLSYFSLVAALAGGTRGILGDLDLSYSLISLLELILQNIFIIQGLHRHPKLLAKKKDKRRRTLFKVRRENNGEMEETQTDFSLLESATPVPPAGQEQEGSKPWTTRAIQELCAFLILANIMLWVIPAFGAHPQFENGLGKQFFGFTAWFVLVNLGQPLSVFYRMHSVGALMELLISA